ncbi:fas apoptotic inhibitory molecule 3 isoform X2 [Myotis myotis]|uniref:fas apoptotic inhibitory molecule 3 isoform X2 n=1 Tax=Myotis myotis TaxID=51298 RepID=UPI00174D9BB9|nr:fas apoptotic inhibitory molecule 3 isoform X2 [Myotis myotis]
MDPWLWLIYFLPTVSGALVLPEVKLEGMLGGSITIECPLPETYTRAYLCREIDKSQACFTVVSSMRFVRKEYKHRVTLKLYPDQNLFLVEVTELTQSDSGVYACGTGLNTDRGKSQKVTLDVHSEYDPFWEEEPFPPWRVPPMEMLPWFQKPVLASSLEEVLSQVTSPAPRTEAPPAHPSSPTPPVTHRPRVSRSSAVVAAKLTTRLPSTTSSKTPAPERLLRPQTASYNQHTRLHRQRASHHSPASRMEDQGFHLLIPTFLSLILLTLLGLLVTRIIQRKKALSRRASRLALRMSALAASQRPQAQRPRVSPRPRSQNNVYSACPRRDRGAHAAGDLEAPIPRPGASAPPAPPQVRPAPAQVSEAPWPHVPSLKTSCEYMTVYHQPAAMMEDADSDEYVNIYCLTHPSSCPPGPRPLRQ